MVGLARKPDGTWLPWKPGPSKPVAPNDRRPALRRILTKLPEERSKEEVEEALLSVTRPWGSFDHLRFPSWVFCLESVPYFGGWITAQKGKTSFAKSRHTRVSILILRARSREVSFWCSDVSRRRENHRTKKDVFGSCSDCQLARNYAGGLLGALKRLAPPRPSNKLLGFLGKGRGSLLGGAWQRYVQPNPEPTS